MGRVFKCRGKKWKARHATSYTHPIVILSTSVPSHQWYRSSFPRTETGKGSIRRPRCVGFKADQSRRPHNRPTFLCSGSLAVSQSDFLRLQRRRICVLLCVGKPLESRSMAEQQGITRSPAGDVTPTTRRGESSATGSAAAAAVRSVDEAAVARTVDKAATPAPQDTAVSTCGRAAVATSPAPVYPRIADTGITELPNESSIEADLCFVHGLMGHPQKTWQYGKSPKRDASESGEEAVKQKKTFNLRGMFRSKDKSKSSLLCLRTP
jgi:hypothetical protein